jgi:hypothetical protein
VPSGGSKALHVPPALIAVLPSLVYAVLWFLLLDPRPAPGGDNLLYLLLARGLAEGRGLTEFWLPQTIPHTRYPFAFPALLAPVYALSHGSLTALKAAIGILGLGSVVLTQVYLGRRGPAIGFWGALAMALSPLLLEFAGDTFTEVPFLAITLLSLFLYDLSESGRRRGPLVAALGLSVLGIWVRLVGIALAAAYAIVLLRVGRRGSALAAGVALAAGLALWAPSLLSQRGSVAELAGTYELAERQSPPTDSLASQRPQAETAAESVPGPRERITHRLSRALRLFFLVPAPLAATLFPWTASLAFLRVACTLLVLAVMALFVARLVRGSPGDPVPAYLVLSGGLLFVWSAALERFFLPLLPFLLLAFLVMARDQGARALAAAGVVLAGSQLVGAAIRLPDILAARKEIATGNEPAGLPGVIAQSRRAALWARTALPPGAVLAARKPPVTFYYSDRATVPYPQTTDASAFAKELVRTGAGYLLVEPGGLEGAYLIPFYRAYAAKLPLVFETGEPWNVVVLDLAPLHEPRGTEPADRLSTWPPQTRFPR